jgi:DNA-binding transcriptional regulator YiaG
MTQHNEAPGRGEVRVLERKQKAKEGTLDTYDATPHVGIRTIVCNAAIERVDDDGEETIEIPKLRELRAAAAIMRCLMPVKLQGWEIRALRKILNMTLTDLAGRLDERTAVETVSRWEAGQPMGAYADKVFRLLVCETLKTDAPGIEYNGAMLANLKVVDPFKADPDFELTPVVLMLIRLKEQASGSIIETWNGKRAA